VVDVEDAATLLPSGRVAGQAPSARMEGFEFSYAELEPALREVLSRSRRF
jgi:NAD dependent epimerase/dehydratase family enzyme